MSCLIDSNIGAPTYLAPPVDPTPPSNAIPSQRSELIHSASLSEPNFIPSTLAPPGAIPTAPLPISNPLLIPTDGPPTDVTTVLTTSQGNATGTPPMLSTVEGLKPIPPAATQIGDPDGHHEISEPNFSSTRPCRGCSPVFEIPATGWLDNPVGEQHGSTIQEEQTQAATADPPQVTISAGISDIVIGQAPSHGDFVIGSSFTLTPGQIVTVGDTPIVVETSEGKTKIVVGTTVISLQPFQPAITDAPMSQPPVLLPPILTIGTEVIAPNAQTEYVIADQTLSPGGEPLTISGTTLILAPSATALIINGETSSITPMFGDVYTSTVAAALTFKDHVYTPNRAGYIVISPGTTLVPGGAPITVDGTTLSLEHSGTAVVVQGTTMSLQPVTTVVTLTKGPDALGTGSGGDGGNVHGQSTGNGYAYPTGEPIIAGATRTSSAIPENWLGSFLLLIWWGTGYLAVRL